VVSAAQPGYCFEELDDLIGTQHDRQLLRLTRGDDAFQCIALAEGHAVEEPQRADRLVDVGPRSLLRDQMQLVGAHGLQAQPIRRTVEMAAEPGDRVDVGLLGRRGEIADHHVVDHPPTQRADRSHRKLLSEGWVGQPAASQTGDTAVEVSFLLPPQRFRCVPSMFDS
jgi:hypothetical protein